MYQEFDDCLPNQEGLEDTFREIIKYIRKELMDTVRSTKFRLQVRTYSLIVSLADSLSGIPDGLGPVELRPGPDICRRMVEVDERLRPAAVPLGLAALKGALTHATSHVPQRRVRNEHFVKMLFFDRPRLEPALARLDASKERHRIGIGGGRLAKF